jgi:sn-glycerol 3-phosphate transport system substrate-binding protein
MNRHHHRHRTVVLAALVATALALAGCGGSSDTATKGPSDSSGGAKATADLPPCPIDQLATAPGPAEIVIWYALSAKSETSLLSLVDKYNASQTKVKVRAEKQGAAYEELLRKYQSAIQSKALPDLAIMEDTTTRFMIDSDTVLPAQSCLNAEKMTKDAFVQTAVDHYSVDKVLYPASANLSDVLTYYNKNHFRRAGLDPAKAPQTLDQVREYAQKIKAAGVVDKPVILKLDSWFIETQLTGSEKPVVNNANGRGPDKTTEAAFDTAETRKLFTWIRDMTRDGLMQAVPATDGQVDHYLAMAAQKASITIETSTAATSVKAFLGGDTSVVAGSGVDAGGVDTKALDIGAGEVFGVTAPGKAQVGGGAWYMMKTSAPVKQAAAWDFMKWWNQVDQQVAWHLEGSYLPWVLAAAQDPRVQTFWTDDLAGRWLAIAYSELVNGVNPDFTGPLIGPYDKFRVSLRGGMDDVVFKNADPDAAVAKAATETTAALTEYNDAGF